MFLLFNIGRYLEVKRWKMFEIVLYLNIKLDVLKI